MRVYLFSVSRLSYDFLLPSLGLTLTLPDAFTSRVCFDTQYVAGSPTMSRKHLLDLLRASFCYSGIEPAGVQGEGLLDLSAVKARI